MIIATYLKEWQSTLVYPRAGDTNQTREVENAKLFFYGTFLKSHMYMDSAWKFMYPFPHKQEL
jgi:hypothetical protein